jgi:hypothetical protein
MASSGHATLPLRDSPRKSEGKGGRRAGACLRSEEELCYSPRRENGMGLEPNYIIVDGQTFNKAKLALDNHVYKNCHIDDCDLYYSGGQYELLDTHITNSRLILNHPAKGIYNALQIFRMKSPGSRIIYE